MSISFVSCCFWFFQPVKRIESSPQGLPCIQVKWHLVLNKENLKKIKYVVYFMIKRRRRTNEKGLILFAGRIWLAVIKLSAFISNRVLNGLKEFDIYLWYELLKSTINYIPGINCQVCSATFPSVPDVSSRKHIAMSNVDASRSDSACPYYQFNHHRI